MGQRLTCSLFCVLLFSTVANSQYYFSKSFLLTNADDASTAKNIQPYEDGFLMLVGRAGDEHEYAALCKINTLGDTIWSRDYYLESQYAPPDAGYGMVVDDEFVYYGAHFNNGADDMDLQILCISRTTLDTVWVKTYEHPHEDFIVDFLATPDEGLVMVSAPKKPTGVGYFLRLTKTDKQGNVLWDNFYDDFQVFYPRHACIGTDGNLWVACRAKPFGEIYNRAIIKKVDMAGNVLLTKKYRHTEGFNMKVSITPLLEGKVALGWVRDTFAPGGTLYTFPPSVLIIDSLGDILAEHVFDHRWLRDLIRLRTLPNGDILGVGRAGGQPDVFDYGGWLFRMSPAGELLWQRAVRDTRHTIGVFFDATPTPDGGIIACGDNDSFSQGLTYVWVFKIGGNGCYETNCDSLELYVSPTWEPVPQQESPYQLYPNPATYQIQVAGLTGHEQALELYDNQGRLVLRTTLPRTEGITVGQLPAGCYTAKILLKNYRFATTKLFKP